VKAPYVFDTNSVSVLRNYYPDQFPSFWKRFHAAVSAGEVVSCREVLHELKGLQKGWLLEWAEANKAMFRMPSDAETNFVGEIFKVAALSRTRRSRAAVKGNTCSRSLCRCRSSCLWWVRRNGEGAEAKRG